MTHFSDWPLWSVETLFIVGFTFVLAGLVKGVVGLGLPTVSLAILTAALGLQPAMALLLVPSFITNLWQAVVGGQAIMILRRSGLFLLAAFLCIWPGAHILAGGDTTLMAKILGGLLIIYSIISLTRPALSLSQRHESWAGLLAGGINGVLTGMTGSFVMPGVLYLQALGLPRDTLVQAMGILFTLSTVGLAAALGERQLLSVELGLMSTAAVVPAVAGMILGQRIRRQLSEARFKAALFLSLLAVGLYIVLR